jgi:glycosyltransferase involved in cell wall biosynthesis
VLKRYSSRLTYWNSARDAGQAQAINLGFKHASGEIMAWLNSDDVLLPGALEDVGWFFARHRRVDVIYGHRLLIDENDKEVATAIDDSPLQHPAPSSLLTELIIPPRVISAFRGR